MLISAATVNADDHSASGPMDSIGIVASDAPAVLAAMDKWRTSKTGKMAPNTVVLLQNIVNGDYKSTHGINIFYPNGAAMDSAASMYAESEDWSSFQSVFQSLVETEWENTYAILRAKANAGDVSSATPVSITYGLTVSDANTFMRAFDVMWDSEVIQDFPGAVYLQVIAQGEIRHPFRYFQRILGKVNGSNHGNAKFNRHERLYRSSWREPRN